MALVLTSSQKVKLSIVPVDIAGNPAPVEAVKWESSSTEIITIYPEEEGLTSVYAMATGPVGKSQVVVKADALIGDGMEELIGVLDIEVVPSKAVSLAIASGLPEPK